MTPKSVLALYSIITSFIASTTSVSSTSKQEVLPPQIFVRAAEQLSSVGRPQEPDPAQAAHAKKDHDAHLHNKGSARTPRHRGGRSLQTSTSLTERGSRRRTFPPTPGTLLEQRDSAVVSSDAEAEEPSVEGGASAVRPHHHNTNRNINHDNENYKQQRDTEKTMVLSQQLAGNNYPDQPGVASSSLAADQHSATASTGGTATHHTSSGSFRPGNFWVQPLLFSVIAGASTSIGALIVVLNQGRMTNRMMAFSLSLASGVMTAVSLLSLQEVFAKEKHEQAHTVKEIFGSLCFIALGAVFYFMLSKFALPDTQDYVLDDVEQQQFKARRSAGGTTGLDPFSSKDDPDKQLSHDTQCQSDPDNSSHPNSDPEKAAILGKEHHHRTILSPDVVRVHSGSSILQNDTTAAGKKISYSDSPPAWVGAGGSSPRGRGPNNSKAAAAAHQLEGPVVETSRTISEHSSSSTNATAADHRMIRVLASPTSVSTPRTEQEMHIAGGAILAAEQNTSNQGDNNSKSTSVLSSSSSHQGALATRKRSWRITMLLFLSLLLHNFPEGLAVAISTLENTQLGITITFGILVHNIPEGIAIAVPCLAAKPNQPKLAFWLASLSGIAEPIGAALGLLFVSVSNGNSKDNTTLPVKPCLAFVAGVMMMVVVYDLVPESLRWDPVNSGSATSTPTGMNNNAFAHQTSRMTTKVSSTWKDLVNWNKYFWVKIGFAAGMMVMVFTEMLLDSVM
ncbi:unnamed protein product [Amoebophrya sp. A120]|nr:unnamed protein product [Amoebophrya sp. A120]|eukprot:GSA120T00014329001.1